MAKKKLKIHIKVVKEQFVPAEFSLLKEWAPILEKETSKSTLVYLQLQTGIHRNPNHEYCGYSWISREEIIKRCRISNNHFAKCMKVLTKYGLIELKRQGQGKPNLYTIPNLPDFRSIDLNTSRSVDLDTSKSVNLNTLNKETNKEQHSVVVDYTLSSNNNLVQRLTDLGIKEKNCFAAGRKPRPRAYQPYD